MSVEFRTPPPAASDTAPPAAPAVDGVRRHRWSAPRWLRVGLFVIVLGVAIHLLLPRVGELQATTTALHHASAALLGLAFVAVLASYPLSAVALRGAAADDLPLLRTAAVELAGTFLNRITPAGVGRVGVLTRYLTRRGTPPLQVAGVLGLNLAAALLVHAAGLVAAAAAARASVIRQVQLPDRWADLLSVLAVLCGAGLVTGAVLLRRRRGALASRLGSLRAQLRVALTRPGSVAALLGGVTGVNAVMIGALALCLAGFGAHPSVAVVALVYLGGSAVASVAPTPGGLGAMEAALVAGLTGLGVSTGPAVAGVLTFRLLSWWIPALIGAVAWTVLHRKRVV